MIRAVMNGAIGGSRFTKYSEVMTVSSDGNGEVQEVDLLAANFMSEFDDGVLIE